MLQLNCFKVTNSTDLNNAFNIRHKVFIDEQKVPEQIERDEFDKSSTHFIAYSKEKPIATARIRPYSEDVVKVERVAVLKEFRNKGIGKILLNYIENFASDLGYCTIRLNSQENAISFYLKLNYSQIGQPFYEADIKHISMKKNIC